MGSETPVYDKIPEFRHRLVDFAGYGFLLGAGGGSAFHFVRGLCSSPSGARLVGGVRAVGTNGPRVAGRLGAFLAVYCAFERALSRARLREDAWSCIAAGAATGGLFGMRRGAPAAARSAFLAAALIVGGVGTNWAIDLQQSRLTYCELRPARACGRLNSEAEKDKYNERGH